MPRSLNSRSWCAVALAPVLTAAALALSACAFEDGQPWGVVALSGEVRFDLPEDRLTPEGAIRTAHDFVIEIEAAQLRVDRVALTLGGATSADFDPADPPPGYSLCHNGHCHADDGRLVDYEDIAAELRGGDDAPRMSVPVDDAVDLAPGAPPAALAVTDCTPEAGCPMQRGQIAVAGMVVTGIALTAHVRDRREGDAARLPPEGVAVALTLEDAAVEATLERAVDVPFGPGHPLVARLDLRLAVPAQIVDAVAWDDAAAREGQALASTLAAALAEGGELTIDVHREDR